MLKLSKRLQAVADLAAGTGKSSGIDCVADVGTDHGYIPIWLVKQGNCGRAIAMDIRKGPLQRAREHIKEHQLGAYIETRLSDGLAALKQGEAQVIIIAGMGGATMSGILEAGRTVIGPDTVLVLQPQSEIMEFRRYLFTHGYRLLEEDMVQEDGKYYPMMKVQQCVQTGQPEAMDAVQTADTVMSQPVYTEQELYCGPLLLAQRHPVLREFLLWQMEQKEKLLIQLREHAAQERGDRRKRQIEAEAAAIRQILLRYEET